MNKLWKERICDINYRKMFFRFPFKRPEILQLWVKAIRRENWKPTKSSKLCSNHFISSDFIPRQMSKMKLLKPDAVPSVFNFPKHLQKEVTLTTKRKRILKVCTEVQI